MKIYERSETFFLELLVQFSHFDYFGTLSICRDMLHFVEIDINETFKNGFVTTVQKSAKSCLWMELVFVHIFLLFHVLFLMINDSVDSNLCVLCNTKL